MDRPAIATDLIRLARSRGAVVDERRPEPGLVELQLRTPDGSAAVDLVFFVSATSGRWRHGKFRGIRNAQEVPVGTIREAAEFVRAWL